MNTPLIACIGVSHKTAQMNIRERLYLSKEDIELALPKIKDQFNLKELVILSTCNRFEVYIVADRHDTVSHDEHFCKILLTLQNYNGVKINCFQLLKNSSYIYKDQAAIHHMYSVVASLDSLVVGETQITGQFKKAIELSESKLCFGSISKRLSSEALRIAKRVRSETDIGKRTVSISHAAIDLAKKVYRDLNQYSFLFIGAGEMAEVAAQYAKSYNPQNIYVANRSLSRACSLTEKLGTGRAVSMEEVPHLLEQVDIVVSSTSAKDFIITYEQLKEITKKRKGKSLFLVDIALPRDIEPRCSEIEDIYLFEVDDLKKVVEKNINKRKEAIEDAKNIITEGCSYFEQWLTNQNHKPMLQDAKQYIENLVSKELEKTLSKSFFSNLNETQSKSLERMKDSIASKFVADIAKALSQDPTHSELPKHMKNILFTSVQKNQTLQSQKLVQKSDISEYTKISVENNLAAVENKVYPI